MGVGPRDVMAPTGEHWIIDLYSNGDTVSSQEYEDGHILQLMCRRGSRNLSHMIQKYANGLQIMDADAANLEEDEFLFIGFWRSK